jgi:hypothetical protein
MAMIGACHEAAKNKQKVSYSTSFALVFLGRSVKAGNALFGEEKKHGPQAQAGSTFEGAPCTLSAST